MSLSRVLVCDMNSAIYPIQYKGEQAFVLKNDILGDVDWTLVNLLQINPLMIIGECVLRNKGKRLQAVGFGTTYFKYDWGGT